tara:strand:+ start:6006 stop:6182 length:177 start_codon:yes stop_codon:yes gene_type:complete
MKKIQIRIGFTEGWQDFDFCSVEVDFDTAIDLVRASKLTGVRIRQQNENGSVTEWDNF